LIASVAIAVSLAYWYHLGVAYTIATIMVGGGAPAMVYLAWEGFLISFRQAEESEAESEAIRRDADDLAESVKEFGFGEEKVRQFNDYSALMVTWKPPSPDLSLTVEWEELVKLATGPGKPAPPPAGTWADGPEDLAGFDKNLPDVLRRVPTGWLVVLGGPGAGKSMLMLRLVVDLLGKRPEDSGDPVPVLLSVASWDPEKDTFYAWLERRLIIDHPGLADYVPTARGERTRIAALLAHRKIIPILDGLDEMPLVARRKVIARLNDVLFLPDCPPQLVITCRVGDYAKAVGEYGKGRIPLLGAAAIELQPLDVDQVVNYLTDNNNDPRWVKVARRLHAAKSAVAKGTSRSAVALALQTPLYVSLAAAVYNPHPDDPEELKGHIPDPAELTDPKRFKDQKAIQDHLLKEFIPAAYRNNKDQVQRVRKQLRFLADYLTRKNGDPATIDRNLQWWTLQDLGPRDLVPVVVGAVCGIGTGLAAGLGSHVGVGIGYGFGIGMLVALAIAQVIRHLSSTEVERPGPGMAGGLIGGLIGGVVAGVAAKAHIGHDPSLFSGLPEALGMGIGAGASTSRVGGFVGALIGGFVGGLLEGVGLGLPAGIINGVGVGVAAGLAVKYVGRKTPARRNPEWDPWVGIAGGAVIGLALGVIAWAREGPVAGVVAGLLIGAAAAWPVGLGHTEQKLSVVPSPGQALQRDAKAFRRTTLAAGLAAGAFGFVGGSMTSIIEVGAKANLHTVVSDGLGIGLASALVIGLTFGFYHAASAGFLIVSWWLALTGKTPWRLQRFLDDAYRRSVLRHVGADYQFRHDSLQDHLVRGYWPDGSPRAGEATPASA
jgi:hypothetical protein